MKISAGQYEPKDRRVIIKILAVKGAPVVVLGVQGTPLWTLKNIGTKPIRCTEHQIRNAKALLPKLSIHKSKESLVLTLLT